MERDEQQKRITDPSWIYPTLSSSLPLSFPLILEWLSTRKDLSYMGSGQDNRAQRELVGLLVTIILVVSGAINRILHLLISDQLTKNSAHVPYLVATLSFYS